MMEYVIELVWGIVSLLMFLVILVYNHRVVKHFRENRKVASTRIFLEGRTVSAFKVFSIGAVFYAVTALVGVATLSSNEQIYRYGSKIGAGSLFLAWLYFMKTMDQATDRPDSEP